MSTQRYTLSIFGALIAGLAGGGAAGLGGVRCQGADGVTGGLVASGNAASRRLGPLSIPLHSQVGR